MWLEESLLLLLVFCNKLLSQKTNFKIRLNAPPPPISLSLAHPVFADARSDKLDLTLYQKLLWTHHREKLCSKVRLGKDHILYISGSQLTGQVTVTEIRGPFISVVKLVHLQKPSYIKSVKC